jgi:hypothetical protein
LLSFSFLTLLLLVGNPNSVTDVTPDYLWKNQLQVIVIYPVAVPGLFWPRNLCLSPWANTTSSAKLRRFLTAGLAWRRPDQLFVSQGVFTPSLATILANIRSDLERSCSVRCNRTLLQWLNQTEAAKLNIVIVDFLLTVPTTCDILDLLITSNYGDVRREGLETVSRICDLKADYSNDQCC